MNTKIYGNDNDKKTFIHGNNYWYFVFPVVGSWYYND